MNKKEINVPGIVEILGNLSPKIKASLDASIKHQESLNCGESKKFLHASICRIEAWRAEGREMMTFFDDELEHHVVMSRNMKETSVILICYYLHVGAGVEA